MRKEHIFKIGDKRHHQMDKEEQEIFFDNFRVFEFLRISVREIP
jgi:hypothetical protein